MKLTIEPDRLTVSRNKTAVAVSVFALIVGMVAFGVTFVWIGRGDGIAMMAAFGWFFLAAAGAALFAFLNYLHRIRHSPRVLVMEATREGLRLAPLTGMDAETFPWAAIDRILLARKVLTKSASETGYGGSSALVYLADTTDLGLIERSEREIWKSPQGHNVIQVNVPGRDIERLHAELQRLAGPDVLVRLGTRLVLDNVKGEERLED